MNRQRKIRQATQRFVALCIAFIAVTDVLQALAQSDLPADVWADILQRKIFDSAQAKDLQNLLAEIDDYKALKVEIPPPKLLVEAQAAHRTGNSLRAFKALKALLAVGQRGSKGYDQALALYSVFEKEAGPAIQKAEEAKQLAEAQRREAEMEQQRGRELKADLNCGGESFEAFGMKVPAQAINLWGTVLIIAVQLYFLAHLIELSGKLSGTDAALAVAWVGVYRGLFARTLFVTSALLLPAAAAWILGIKWIMIAESRLLWIAAIAGMGASTVLSVLTARHMPIVRISNIGRP